MGELADAYKMIAQLKQENHELRAQVLEQAREISAYRQQEHTSPGVSDALVFRLCKRFQPKKE